VTAIGKTLVMPFGQPSGPPASSRQVQELLTRLQAAGHSDFRDARGPMGFSQRQAAGKFTRDEAQAFIEQLDQAEHAESPGGNPTPDRPSAAELALRKFTDTQLAAELQRRGWVVMEP
jgi:hypothetical protein